MENIISKKCTKCWESKSVSYFHKNKKNKDGLAYWCKDCKHVVRAKHYLENKDEQLFACKQWKNNQTAEWRRERHRKEYYSDVEKSRAKWRIYNRKFRDKNPDKISQYLENYRAKKIVSGGKVSSEEWKSLKSFYGNVCLCCGRGDVKLTQDHIVPLSKDGIHHIDNIQPLCKSCNSSKGAKTIDYRRNIR